MTTIAWDLTTLATDSMCTMGSTVFDTKMKKLYRNIGPFEVVCISGYPEELELVFPELETLDSLSTLNSLSEHEGLADSELVLLTKVTHLAYLLNSAGLSQLNKPWATGSGGRWAIAALDHGATAVEAIKYAATRDLNTNTRIQKYSIPNKCNKGN